MLYVLDGSYYVFRAFYALREMTNSRGFPTNGLYAFTNMLLNVVRDRAPSHLAVAFDPPGPVFRNELFPDYKANRDETPEALVPQFPYFRRIVDALGLNVLEVPGFEADDIIATLVERAERANLTTVVLTGDKDLYQLVSERTTLEDSMRDKRVGLADVLERFAVAPNRVADVLGLSGDTSDNIPGVPGIGEKTAGKLVAEFGSLEEVLARVDEVSGVKRREMLREHAEIARLSKVLATVRRDVPIDVELDSLRLRTPEMGAFDALCEELEFRRFPRAAREVFAVAAPPPPRQSGLGPLFDSQPDSPSKPTQTPTTPVADLGPTTANETATLADLVALLAGTATDASLALEIVTDGGDPDQAAWVGVAVAVPDGARGVRAAYVPIGHSDLFAAQTSAHEVVGALRDAVQDEARPKVIADAKRAERLLASAGLQLRGVRFDPSLAGYLVDPNARAFDVATLAQEHLGVASGDERGERGRPSTRAASDAGTSACARVDAALRLEPALGAELAGAPRQVHDQIELPLTHVLARMESTGVCIDLERLAAMSAEFHTRIDALTAEVHELAGRSFAINSPTQLATVLFDELGLPVQRRGKSGPSTDAAVLEVLAEHHPIAERVLDYREVTKLASTYIDALPRLVRRETGRVHTTFNQCVAATGRLSSSDPNLQNIPIRTSEGRRIREAFVAAPGWILFGGDYSQIELRVLAHMSEDPVLIDAFRRGEDIHRRTAAEVLEIAPDDVTPEQRSQAKAINFGLIYGMGARRLGKTTGSSHADAQAYMDRYFHRIARVQPFMSQLVQDARASGYAETLAGRRRPIPELARGTSRREFALGERLAMNTPIQGTAADIMKLAMIAVQRELDAAGLQTRMLLTVHDELLFEAPPAELDRAMTLVRSAMEGAMQLRVPLAVDLHSGGSWAELK
ncbi:MAG: DNA polymerase I [Myxococcales bacterium]|nr:DNA polymerase I [Myxococcales bacterium]MCB9519611.1 DNA polymerase I [Myxococcales bacterium]MCB9530662.1 DNA polymerase I [Myxococcales bacterium]MCB9533583.1 DNA polymerase I [Myxococcales bacterium]